MKVDPKVLLCITGFFQVAFVSANTYFISEKNVSGMIVASFMISIIWTINVKRVAFGGWFDRVAYAAGASAGTVAGFLVAKTFF